MSRSSPPPIWRKGCSPRRRRPIAPPSAGPAGRRPDADTFYPFQRNNSYGVNAQIDYKTDAGTLTIIPAWRYGSLNYLAEAAAFPYRNREKDQQFSVEGRFTGNRIGVFDYTLGGYFYDDSIHARTELNLSASANFNVQPYTTRSFAPFGRLTAHITDRLRVVGGVRYSKDIKHTRPAAPSVSSSCPNSGPRPTG